VDEEYPDLMPRYERAYPGSNAPHEYQRALDERVERIRVRHGFVADSMRRPALSPTETAALSDAPAFQRVGPQLRLPIVY